MLELMAPRLAWVFDVTLQWIRHAAIIVTRVRSVYPFRIFIVCCMILGYL